MRLTSILIGIALLGGTTAAIGADEPMDRATPNKSELMNDCIRRHQSGDVNLSKAEIKRICKDEIKSKKTVGDAPPPHDPPKN